VAEPVQPSSGRVMCASVTSILDASDMANLNCHTVRAEYKGLEALSEIGFKRREILLGDLFPTADEIVLSMEGCFHRLDESASVMYELSSKRFSVVEDDGRLEMAVPDPKGDYTGFIIDVLAVDSREAKMMMEDVKRTCGFVRARVCDAIGIMEISEEDYIRRMRDSMKFLAGQLHRG